MSYFNNIYNKILIIYFLNYKQLSKINLINLNLFILSKSQRLLLNIE
jgi:hypothetical protein